MWNPGNTATSFRPSVASDSGACGTDNTSKREGDSQSIMDLTHLGKGLLIIGGLTLVAGLALMLLGRVTWLGHLPGDIAFRRGNVSCYVPLVSSLLLSLLLTIVLNLLLRLLGR